MSYNAIADELGMTYNAVRNRVRRQPGYNADKPNKLEVFQNVQPEIKKATWKGTELVRFALIGDTHINSMFTQLTFLYEFYDICKKSGVKHIYHTGDIDEGEQMRMGHQYECYTQGADAHVEEICRVYPSINGITTHFITGNHDASITKRCGHDIGIAIAAKRTDMDYLGRDCAIVKLTPNCMLELRHPWGGSAYALSYKPQKMIDAMSGGEKPNILAIGHYHKAEYMFYRNVHSFQTGTFCGQTSFMKGMGLSAHMGGWIIEALVDSKGYLKSIKPELVPFYKAIDND